MESHSTSSTVSIEEDYHLSEAQIADLIDKIFESNKDQALMDGLDILLTLIGK
jgi:hypothetical protein